MAGGAVIVAAAAAQRRRLAEVVEAFRVAGATAPDRARPLDEALSGHGAELSHLAQAGVLVADADNWWYLDEVAYANWQRTRRQVLSRRAMKVLALALVVVAVFIVLALWMGARTFE